MLQIKSYTGEYRGAAHSICNLKNKIVKNKSINEILKLFIRFYSMIVNCNFSIPK